MLESHRSRTKLKPKNAEVRLWSPSVGLPAMTRLRGERVDRFFWDAASRAGQNSPNTEASRAACEGGEGESRGKNHHDYLGPKNCK